jgi:signal peptidase II
MPKARAGRSGMNLSGMTLFFAFTGFLILLDQVTKYLVVRALPINTGKPIIPGFFNLVHVHNTGGAFSVFAGQSSPLRQYVFIALTLIVVACITFAYRKVPKKDWWTRAAYILISGGALGNLVDRVRMGEVVDFLDFYVGRMHWPAFNVADSAISVGAVMLFISLFRNR